MARKRALLNKPLNTLSSSCTLRELISLKIYDDSISWLESMRITSLHPHKGVEHDGVVLRGRIRQQQPAPVRDAEQRVAVENKPKRNGELVDALACK